MTGAPYVGHIDLARATSDYLKSLPSGAEVPRGHELELYAVQFMAFKNVNAGYTADGKPRSGKPVVKHPKLDRNIVLERFAASVATGWFASFPDDANYDVITSNKSGTAKAIIDMGEALTDEFMRRIEQ